MPGLWTGRRVAQFCALAIIGVVQAGVALGLSLMVARLLSGAEQTYPIHSYVLVSICAFAAVVLAVAQFRYSEALALSYIHELRMRFVEHVMLRRSEAAEPKLGLVMTRIVNDMSAIKLWVSRGLVTFFSVIPMLITISIWLYFFATNLLVVLGISVSIWVVLLGVTIAPLTNAIRSSRRRRGGIASYAGGVIQARVPLLLAGQLGPTLRKLDRRSIRLTHSLVQRATWSGALRASGQLVLPLSALLYVVSGVASHGNQASTTLFLMIAAFVSAQLTLISAGLEYYQGSKIALQKLSSILDQPVISPTEGKRLKRKDWQNDVVADRFLFAATGRIVDFKIHSAQASILNDLTHEECEELFSTLLGLNCEERRTPLFIGTYNLAQIETRDLWRRVGYLSPSTNPITKCSSRLSDESKASVLHRLNITENSRTLGVGVSTSESHSALTVRVAKLLIRNPCIVLVDDVELFAHEDVAKIFLDECNKRDATVIVKNTLPANAANMFVLRNVVISGID